MVVIRELEPSDYDKQYIELINGITNEINNITKHEFYSFINDMQYNYKIYVIEKDNIIIGTITLIIENKLIHNLGKVCHIEDLTIHKDFRNKGYASVLLKYSKYVAKQHHCYKIILNCKEELEKFYKKNGFSKSSIQMRINI